MKLSTFGSILAATAAFSTAQAQIVPITTTGYNEDVIVENSATLTNGQTYLSAGYVTASEDYGINGNGRTGSADSFFESGLLNDSNGLPTSGDIGTSYAFQSYAANNALVLNSHGDAPSSSGTLTFSTPTALTQLSLFGNATSGSGGDSDAVIVHFADSTTESFTASNVAQDWYSGSNGIVLGSLDRVDVMTNTGIDNGNAEHFKIYQDTFTLSDTSAVTGVDITYGGGGIDFVYGVSGTLATTPEPSTWAMMLLGAGALTLVARRRLS